MPAKIEDEDWVGQDRYRVDDRGCWLWSGCVSHDGYGKCRRTGQTLAHRAFFTILKGPIGEGLELDHLCKNRLCVNPDHLEAVTHEENIARGDYTSNHRNGRKNYCKRGHKFDAKNTVYRKQPSGKTARRCRVCQNMLSLKRYYERKAAGK